MRNVVFFRLYFSQKQTVKCYTLLFFFAGLFCIVDTHAATYAVASGAFAPCSSGSLTQSGTTFTCAGNIATGNNDVLTATTSVTLVATGNISLARANTVGTTTNRISLQTTSGNITASNTGGTTTVFGNITTSTGTVTFNRVTLTGAMNVGGAIALTTVNLASGSISGASTITLTSSNIGTLWSYVPVTSSANSISLSSSTVFGNITAGASSTVNVPSGSSVTGICLPNSTPANACIAPVCTTGLIGGLAGDYFNNRTLTGAATATRTDNNLNFDWGTGSTGVAGIPADVFSVRWTGFLRAPSTGNYQFQTQSDDGVRVWINNVLVIDNWTDHAVTTDNSLSISLVAGQSYPVRVEYFENGGFAVMKLNWNQPTNGTFVLLDTQLGVTPNTSASCTVPVVTCANGFNGGPTGQYFNNRTLTAPSAGSRVDSVIDFDWGSGTPGVTGVGADNFSVRWNGTIKVATTGGYQFETVSDDGVRLWVNSVLVIDNWTDHGPTSNTTSAITLTAGNTYPIRLEYYENGGGAVMRLRWRKPADTVYTTINNCPSVVSYYAISHSGTGITCAAEPITISAFDAANSLVAPTLGTQITITTAPATGTWATSNTYTFGGTETSAIKYLRQITGSTLNINVTDGSISESASFDPSITFVDSALKFYGDSSLSAMPNQVAGVVSNLPILKAIRTDTNSGACVAQTTGAKTVSFGYECRNPTACVAGQVLSLNGTGIQPNANGSAITYSTQTLTFDGTGTASIPLNYTDVGQVRLHAQLALAATGNDPAITLSGSSNDFVVKPYTLAVSAVQTAASVANPGGTSAAGTAAGFVAAGTAFRVNVEARNFAGNRTPNFGNETVSENNITLTAMSLVYPVVGTLTALSGATSFSPTAPAGTFSNAGVIWNQVGSITARPALADNDYLGAGNLSLLTTSGTIGRFYPDHYTLASSAITNSCGSFSYLSQPAINLSYQLQAQGLTNTVLTNYGTNYGTPATPAYVAENANDGNGVTFSSRLVAGASATWGSGVLSFTSTAASVDRQLTTFAPDGPFTSLQWGLDVVDSFDLRSLQGKNMNAITTGVCGGASCTAATLGTPLVLRYGRLRLDDAFGPETVALPVDFISEYWTGNYFALNTSDSCTIIPRAAVTYPSGSLTVDANRTVALSSGTTQGIYNNIDAAGIHFNAGTAAHYFSKPSAGGTGSFIVGIDLTNLAWLRYDWNQDGNFADVNIPNARISFGSYRGNDRIIYWREKLQ